MKRIKSRSFIAIPPGATIKEQLEDRGMTQKEFAARMGMTEKHISKLINGDVQLTPETAVKLETVLGIPASFWNKLEAIYREKIVKAEAENTEEDELNMAKKFPYKEMADYGWVPETKKSNERVQNLRSFFGVIKLSLLDNEQITCIACRRLKITEKSDLALMAWAQEAKIQAREITVEPIDLKGLQSSIPELRKMTALELEEFQPSIETLLSKYGIALVFLPHLKGSFLQGASFMDGNKIVVGITARGKDSDKFWFSLFHEIGHILNGDVTARKPTDDDDETKADQWAADTLINPDDFNLFVSKGDYSKVNVINFAHDQGIAPGIVAGRLQKEKLIPYNRLNDLKESYEILS